MSTTTCSAMHREPITNHTGDITVFAKTGLISSTTASIIQFCKIPERAMLVNGTCSRGSAGGDVDVSLNGTMIFVADAANRTELAHAGVGLVVSCTASDYPKYKVVTGVTSSATVTGTVKVSITYTMNHIGRT